MIACTRRTTASAYCTLTLRERDNTQLSLVAKFHNLYMSANKEVQNIEEY